VTLDELLAVLRSMAAVPSEGGGHSELDHGLQCGAELARLAPDDVELQVAGLVHDVGHAFADDASHGRAGAAAVRPLLGDRIAALVEGHVPAKRYLVTTDPSYADGLSPGSTSTLVDQGGPLSADELAAFRARSDWEDAVRLRRADDAAKVPGLAVPGLETWVEVLRSVAR
jgi:predicted HD phosphohydrolase